MHFPRIVIMIPALLCTYWPAATQTVNMNRAHNHNCRPPNFKASTLSRLTKIGFTVSLTGETRVLWFRFQDQQGNPC